MPPIRADVATSPAVSTPLGDHSPTNHVPSRTVHACEQCRRRKTKCDGLMPCTRCAAAGCRDICFYGPHIQRKPRPARTTRPLLPKAVVTNTSPSRPLDNVEEAPLTDKGHQELRAGVAAVHPESNAYQFYGASSHWSFVQRLYQRIRRQNDKSAVATGARELSQEGLQQWGLEKQLFTRVKDDQKVHQREALDMAYLPRELGDSFIAIYFEIMHGQAPVLDRKEVEETWQGLWTAHQYSRQSRPKERSILYMVFAIGARLRHESFIQWAEHFYEKAGNSIADVFEETTLIDCHLLLLRGIYATQIGKSNWIYL